LTLADTSEYGSPGTVAAYTAQVNAQLDALEGAGYVLAGDRATTVTAAFQAAP
jgi:hypothetical protein